MGPRFGTGPVPRTSPRKHHPFKPRSSFIGTLLLACSIAAAGAFLGCSIQRFRYKDRTVTVKGLSEKLVKSDLAIWTLTYRNAGNDLLKLEQKSAEDKKLLLSFLKEKAFDGEIEEGTVSVIDKSSREWGEPEKANSNRFIMNGSLTLRSTNVDHVLKNSSKISELIRNGVIISGEPTYHYTKFLDLKQEMLSEASKNAMQAATDLISASSAKLKGIRQANQGSFIIRAKDAYGDEVGNEPSSLEKRIRVVTTVTFNID